MAVPILHCLHEVRQKTPLIKRHRSALACERISPLGSRVNLYKFVRAEPESRENPVVSALGDPLIGTIGPVWRAPGAIASIWREPEGVHHVVVKVNAELAQPHNLVELLHRQRLG